MGENQAAETPDLAVWAVGLATLFMFYRLVRPAIDSQRWSIAFDARPGAPMMAVFSILFLSWILPAAAVPAAILAIATHEYGHVLAYRLAGHPNPKFQLVPFGGVAYSDKPHRDHREAFFIAMMGPGFSLVLVVIGLLAFEALRDVSFEAAAYAYQAAFWIGLLNAINLLPIYPFDGGRALQSILSAAGPQAMRSVMMASALVVTAFAAILAATVNNMWFLLIICVLGLLTANIHLRHAARLPAMSAGDAFYCALVYIATVAALANLGKHFLAGYYGLVREVVSSRLGF